MDVVINKTHSYAHFRLSKMIFNGAVIAFIAAYTQTAKSKALAITISIKKLFVKTFLLPFTDKWK